MHVADAEEATKALQNYQFHELVDAGNGVCKWAVGNTKDEFFESVFRIKAEAKGYRPPEATLADKPPRLFGEYADEWLNLYAAVKENTKSRYISKINILKAYFGDKLLISIEARDVQTFFSGRADYALSYNRDLRNILSQILDSALEDGYIKKNAAKSTRVHITGKPPKGRNALSKAEQRDLICLIPQIERLEDRLFLALAYYTGMRPCEVYGMTWEDIRWDGEPSIHVQRGAPLVHGKPCVKEPKTKAGNRWIGMPPYLVEVLAPHKGTGFILHDKAGAPFTEQRRKLQRRRIRKLTGMAKLEPYDLRHTFVTRAVEAGGTIKAIQAEAGHADTRPTLDTYAHCTPEARSDLDVKMNDALNRIAAASS